jgi:hypothetical protein
MLVFAEHASPECDQSTRIHLVNFVVDYIEFPITHIVFEVFAKRNVKFGGVIGVSWIGTSVK